MAERKAATAEADPGAAGATGAGEKTGTNWGREMMASVVVFLVALPLCMGIAIASGVPPALGLVSGIIGGLVVGSLAGSPLQVSGPAAGLAVVVWDLVQTFGIVALGVAVLAAGLLQVVAGLAKMGRWFRAVSPALIQGMLAGIGVLILASQFHVMVDAKPVSSGLENLLAIPSAVMRALSPAEGASHQLAAAIGIITIVTIVEWNKHRPSRLKAVPGPLLAVIVSALIANYVGMSVNFVSVPENLVAALNVPTMPTFALLLQPAFLTAVFGMALIASAETLLCATAVDALSPHSKTDYDKELVAQGVGNALAGALGALPITGVIVRSSANVEAGATTRWSAVVHGAWLLLLVALLPVVLSYIPTSCLGAILVYIGYKLADPKQIVKQWHSGRGEAAVFVITVVGIVTTNLLTGVVIGMACAMLKLLATVSRLDIDVDSKGDNVEVALHGSATFVRLPTMATALEAIPDGKSVVLHVGGLAYVDHACMELLRRWQQAYERTGGRATIAWDDLELRHKAARPRTALAPVTAALPAGPAGAG